MPIQTESIDYYAHTGGENKQLSPTELMESLALAVENVDLVYPGSFERASGYVKVNASTIFIEAEASACVGMHDFLLENLDHWLLYAGRNNSAPTYSRIGKMNPATGAFTPLTPAATPASDPVALGKDFDKVVFCQLDDIAIAVQDQTPALYWDGSVGMTEMRRLGLPPLPAGAVNTVSVSTITTATFIEGKYQFRIVYYTQETLGSYHEGRAADAQVDDPDLYSVSLNSTQVAAGNGIKLELDAIPTSILDRYGQIEGRRIYMTEVDGSKFLWKDDVVGTIAATVTFTDQVATVNNTEVTVVRDLPPLCKIAIVFEGRVHFFNGYEPDYEDGDQGTRLHRSGHWWTSLTNETNGLQKDGKQTVLVGNMNLIDPGSGGQITAAWVHGGVLYCAKDDKVYRIFDVGGGRYGWEIHNPASGVVSHLMVANTENFPFLCSERMIYFFDGVSLNPVGNPQEPLWAKEINPDRLKHGVAAYLKAPFRNRFLALFTTLDHPNQARHNLMMEYDFRLQAWKRRTEIEMAHLLSVKLSATTYQLFSADYEGFVYRWDPNVYNYGAGAQSDDILTGNPTSALADRITDTSQNWTPSEFRNVPVYITTGPGRGQRRVIIENDATNLYISAGSTDWTIIPTTLSKYEIGAYASRYRHRWEHHGQHTGANMAMRTEVTLDAQGKMGSLNVRVRHDHDEGEGLIYPIPMGTVGDVFGTALFGVAVFGRPSRIDRKFNHDDAIYSFINHEFEQVATNAPWRVYGYKLYFKRLAELRNVQWADAGVGVE